MVRSDPAAGAGGWGPDDPVSAARAWLAGQGVPQPEPEPEAAPQPVRERRTDTRRARSARLAGSEDADGDPASVARTTVLRKLAVQARTRHELAKALTARQVPEDVAHQVLDRFEQVGLINDATFARDWVESRQQRRHLSASALRRELQRKGVDREIVDTAVGEVASEDELRAARALAEKKLRAVTGLPREVQYRRLAGALARRGFSGAVTTAVIGPLLDDPTAE